MEIGLPRSERNQIMGLHRCASEELAERRASEQLTEPQLVARAISRLAADPPKLVGVMQRRTTSWLLRPLYAAETRTVAVGSTLVESNDQWLDHCATVPRGLGSPATI